MIDRIAYYLVGACVLGLLFVFLGNRSIKAESVRATRIVYESTGYWDPASTWVSLWDTDQIGAARLDTSIPYIWYDVIDKQPANWRARIIVGDQMLRDGDLLGASQQYDYALQINGRCAAARIGQIRVLMEMRHFGIALERLRNMIDLDPSWDVPFGLSGVCAYARGDYRLAYNMSVQAHRRRAMSTWEHNIQAADRMRHVLPRHAMRANYPQDA